MLPSPDLSAALSAAGSAGSVPGTQGPPAPVHEDRAQEGHACPVPAHIEVDSGCIASRRGVLPFRRLGVADHPAAVAHLMRLPEEQRYDRFSGITSADAIARRYAVADPARLRLFGCFAADQMIGLLELCATPGDGEAELAVTVDASWQGERVGTGLVRLAASLAGLLQVERQTMIYAVSNLPMRRIAARLEFARRVEDFTVVASLELRRAQR
jgi:RimJ/RimL family protein N-acetyltransferase